MAPITLAQAQSGVASAKQNLILSQTNLQLEQLLMKNAMTKNMEDPLLAEAPVIPTDTLKPDEQYEVRPMQDLIQEALQGRPEIATARINLTNLEISRKSIRNALLPTLDALRVLRRVRPGRATKPAGSHLPDGAMPGECYRAGNHSDRAYAHGVRQPVQQHWAE